MLAVLLLPLLFLLLLQLCRPPAAVAAAVSAPAAVTAAVSAPAAVAAAVYTPAAVTATVSAPAAVAVQDRYTAPTIPHTHKVRAKSV